MVLKIIIDENNYTILVNRINKQSGIQIDNFICGFYKDKGFDTTSNEIIGINITSSILFNSKIEIIHK